MVIVKLIMFKDDAHSEAAAITIDANSIKIEGHKLLRCTTHKVVKNLEPNPLFRLYLNYEEQMR